MFGSCLTVDFDSGPFGMVASFLHSDRTSWCCLDWWKSAADFLHLFLSSSNLSLGLRCVSVDERSVSVELGLDIGVDLVPKFLVGLLGAHQRTGGGLG